MINSDSIAKNNLTKKKELFAVKCRALLTRNFFHSDFNIIFFLNFKPLFQTCFCGSALPLVDFLGAPRRSRSLDRSNGTTSAIGFGSLQSQIGFVMIFLRVWGFCLGEEHPIRYNL
jgi:hypothetical protein